MNLLIFAGAGASIELGVPAMRQMALDLIAHLETTIESAEFVERVKARLIDKDGDLELVVDDIDRVCAAEEVLPAFGGEIDKDLVQAAQVTRAEVEWFVQHACERVRAEAAAALWRPLLSKIEEHALTIATTNYDRAVELAATRLGRSLDDGFEAFGSKEWATWRGMSGSATKLLKVHGSTDWYQLAQGTSVVKLRHPMPLFGGVTLDLHSEGLDSLGSALVLPSREKRKNTPPFPEISHELFAAAKDAEILVFVGCSLRDPDLLSLVEESAKRTRTLVVGPSFANAGDVPANAIAVQDTASRFLISTLPSMLASGIFPDPATHVKTAELDGGPRSILDEVVAISDPSRNEDERCIAIEALWNRGVSLGSEEIGPLIEPAAGRSAVDALALVALSRDRRELLGRCEQLSAASQDEGFRRDFALLSAAPR